MACTRPRGRRKGEQKYKADRLQSALNDIAMSPTTQGALDRAVVAAALQAMEASVPTRVIADPSVAAAATAAAAKNTRATAVPTTLDTPATEAAAVNSSSSRSFTRRPAILSAFDRADGHDFYDSINDFHHNGHTIHFLSDTIYDFLLHDLRSMT